MPENKLLSPRETAELLGVPLTWIYDRTCSRSTDPIPHHKLGKYVRFDLEEVKAWLGAHRVCEQRAGDRDSAVTHEYYAPRSSLRTV